MTQASKPRDMAALSSWDWGTWVPVPSSLCKFHGITSDFRCPKDILRVFEEQGDRRGGKEGTLGQREPAFPSDDTGTGREFG